MILLAICWFLTFILVAWLSYKHSVRPAVIAPEPVDLTLLAKEDYDFLVKNGLSVSDETRRHFEPPVIVDKTNHWTQRERGRFDEVKERAQRRMAASQQREIIVVDREAMGAGVMITRGESKPVVDIKTRRVQMPINIHTYSRLDLMELMGMTKTNKTKSELLTELGYNG